MLNQEEYHEMKSSNKVIFLDVDGPLIPATSYLRNTEASFQRIVEPLCMSVVQFLCDKSEAKVVFNTTHNQNHKNTPTIQQACIEAGLSPHHIHADDPKTLYPGTSRDVAVKEWLSRHPEVEDWIAFDDVRFTTDERLILVNEHVGLNYGHLCQAMSRWNLRIPIILL